MRQRILWDSWKFTVGPNHIYPCILYSIVFNGVGSSQALAYNLNSNLKCLRKSSVWSVTIVCELYIHDDLLDSGKEFRHKTMNTIILILILTGNFLNDKRLHINLAHYLISQIWFLMSATCSFAALVLRSENPDILSQIHSNSRSIRNRSTVKTCTW